MKGKMRMLYVVRILFPWWNPNEHIYVTTLTYQSIEKKLFDKKKLLYHSSDGVHV